MDNDLAILAYIAAIANSDLSTCNKRQVGSTLLLPDGSLYLGTNGSKENSCKEQGAQFCTRDKSSIGELEYLTCTSPCAEGSTIIEAILDGKDLRGGVMVSTGFPCSRCRSLIIETGISELYFGNYKDKIPRLKDQLYMTQMICSGVDVYKILESMDSEDIKYKVIEIQPIPELISFAQMGMRSSGFHYLRELMDEDYKKQMMRLAEQAELYLENTQPDDVQSNSILTLTPIL